MVRQIFVEIVGFAVALGLITSGNCQDPAVHENQNNQRSITVQEKLRSLSVIHSQRHGDSSGQRFASGLLYPSEQRTNDRGSEQPGSAGGASLANFSELMRLIESVIDAPWASNGGTATMFPFRNGVRIDPKGMIERLDANYSPDVPSLRLETERAGRSHPLIRLDELGAWQQSTPLRWISLHQLDAQLAECRASKVSANIAMELLGGLCRIDYVAFDSACGEWLIGGPAGNIAANNNGDLLHRDLRLPPILLEDLLTIAPHVLAGRGELGCSIDPVQERLVAAYKMAQTPTSQRGLRSDPEAWAHEWKEKLGRQRAVIIGIPEDSPTGYALLVADAHMKRIALGLEPSVDGLKNYWLEADSIAQTSKGPMVRWWFTLSDSRIPWDTERKIAHLAESNVRVLSQSQMFDAKGDRVATERSDWAADAFARGFTSKFPALQKSYPIYGRLRHIFDLTVAMEIVHAQIKAGHGKPFQCLNQFELQPHLPVAPKEIDSVVSTRRSSDGSISAIISGGVSISPKRVSERIRRVSNTFDYLVIEASPGERDSSSATSPGSIRTKTTQSRDLSIKEEEKPFWR